MERIYHKILKPAQRHYGLSCYWVPEPSVPQFRLKLKKKSERKGSFLHSDTLTNIHNLHRLFPKQMKSDKIVNKIYSYSTKYHFVNTNRQLYFVSFNFNLREIEYSNNGPLLLLIILLNIYRWKGQIVTSLNCSRGLGRSDLGKLLNKDHLQFKNYILSRKRVGGEKPIRFKLKPQLFERTKSKVYNKK